MDKIKVGDHMRLVGPLFVEIEPCEGHRAVAGKSERYIQTDERGRKTLLLFKLIPRQFPTTFYRQ